MERNKQTEAMALLDGMTLNIDSEGYIHGWCRDKYGQLMKTPDYHTDKEIDRMVRHVKETDDCIFLRYLEELSKIVCPDGNGDEWHLGLMICATTEQKIEAFLRAHGEWTDES
jgi:hypothetical protein